MRIILQYPFSEDYEKGYLVTNKEPRRNVILFDSSGNSTTTSFARYIFSIHLKRYLRKDEVVDHVDGNQLHDHIDNLQILSYQENTLKGMMQNNLATTYNYYLCGCGKEFRKSVKKLSCEFPCCSRKCAAKQQASSQPKSILLRNEVREYVKKPYNNQKVLDFIETLRFKIAVDELDETTLQSIYERFLKGENLDSLSSDFGLTVYSLSKQLKQKGYDLTVKHSKIDWPAKEELIELIRNNPMTKVGQILGVSDNAVRKHCKKIGIDFRNLKHQ